MLDPETEVEVLVMAYHSYVQVGEAGQLMVAWSCHQRSLKSITSMLRWVIETVKPCPVIVRSIIVRSTKMQGFSNKMDPLGAKKDKF